MWSNQPSPSEQSRSDSAPGPSTADDSAPSEDLYVRNYDPYWGYDLELTVDGPEAAPTFEATYYLQPGQVKSVGNVLPAGEYEVSVVLDNRREETAACRVSSAPEHTIHVELGNGTVSLTEGLY